MAKVTLQIEDQDLHTILAALRVYQDFGYGDPDFRSPELHDIATNDGQVISHDESGIADLSERINGGSACVENS